KPSGSLIFDRFLRIASARRPVCGTSAAAWVLVLWKPWSFSRSSVLALVSAGAAPCARAGSTAAGMATPAKSAARSRDRIDEFLPAALEPGRRREATIEARQGPASRSGDAAQALSPATGFRVEP